MEGVKAMSYRKLFDGREPAPSMTADELLSVCARIRSYHEQGMMGARALGALASAERPIKVFDAPRQARNWLEDQAKERKTP
jgi:hypothetical protein